MQSSQSLNSRILTIGSCLFCGILILLTAREFHNGIDFFDESLYIAYADRLAEGARFMLDEYNMSQFTGILLTPFVYLFIHMTGSLKGIVLFSRYVFLALSLVSCVVMVKISKRYIHPALALFIGCIPIVYVPFYIHNISYNTVGSLGLTLGLFLLFEAVRSQRGFLLAGMLFGVATISYPPFGLIAILMIPLLWYCGAGLKSITRYTVGGGILAVLLVMELLHVGMTHLQTISDFVLSVGVQGGGYKKIVTVFVDFWRLFLHQTPVIVFAFVALIGRRRYRSIGIFCGLLMVGVVLYDGLFHSHAPMVYLRNMAFIGPVIALITPKDNIKKLLMLMIWLPACFAGIISAWASGNGAINFMIGGLGATMTTLIIISRQCRSIDEMNVGNRAKNTVKIVVSVFLVLLLIMLVSINDRNYGDKKSGELHAKITHGPFAGIYSTEVRKAFCEQLATDLDTLSANHNSILIYDDFPAGYLFTAMRAATNTVWLFSPARYPHFKRQLTIDYLEDNNIMPELVLKMIDVPDNPDPEQFTYRYSASDPIVRFTEQGYRPILTRKYYIIYARKSDVAVSAPAREL